MFCDLAVASHARTADGQCWGTLLGECLLQLGRLPAGSARFSEVLLVFLYESGPCCVVVILVLLKVIFYFGPY